MITVHVKLYGTLPERFEGYDPERGLTVQLSPGERVGDLTARLNISPEETGVVALDGRVAKPADIVPDGARIRIFQVSHGG
jgi:sulfur carrier protein ThiS